MCLQFFSPLLKSTKSLRGGCTYLNSGIRLTLRERYFRVFEFETIREAGWNRLEGFLMVRFSKSHGRYRQRAVHVAGKGHSKPRRRQVRQHAVRYNVKKTLYSHESSPILSQTVSTHLEVLRF